MFILDGTLLAAASLGCSGGGILSIIVVESCDVVVGIESEGIIGSGSDDICAESEGSEGSVSLVASSSFNVGSGDSSMTNLD